MSLGNTAAGDDCEPDASTVEPAVHVLEQQLADTLELAACVDRLRNDLSGDAGGKLSSLLEGLFNELDACCSLFRDRIESFALRLPQTRRIEASSSTDSELFDDGSDCREWLESLLHTYAHYVRASTGSGVKLERMGDLESARIVGKAVEAAEKGLWFIEAYMEGIALGMDRGRLPDWPRASA